MIGEGMNFSVLSKYRTALMGIAILWVMFFHMPLGFYTEFGWFIHRIGFYGVDIFLFLSGVGVYFSLAKRPSAFGFYKARLGRILPAYLFVACLSYCLLKLENGSIAGFLYYISGIGYWTRHARFDWYIPTQFALYLITPLFLCFYKKLSASKRVIYTALWMTLSPVVTAIFYYADLRYLWGTSVRLAIFFLGIHIGSFVYKKKEFDRKTVIFSTVAFLVGTVSAYIINKIKEPEFIHDGLNCYPALIMIPSMCLLIALALTALSKRLPKITKAVVSLLNVFGRYSLELYLLHQRLQSILPKYLNIKNQWLILLITVAAALLLGTVTNALRNVSKSHKMGKTEA